MRGGQLKIANASSLTVINRLTSASLHHGSVGSLVKVSSQDLEDPKFDFQLDSVYLLLSHQSLLVHSSCPLI